MTWGRLYCGYLPLRYQTLEPMCLLPVFGSQKKHRAGECYNSSLGPDFSSNHPAARQQHKTALGLDVLDHLQTHALVFDAVPQPFDEHVVAPRATPVHRKLKAADVYGFSEFSDRKLATLISVDDVRRAVASKGFFDHLLDEACLSFGSKLLNLRILEK